MKDYASMSDRKINMHVASIIYPESTVIESRSRPPCAFVTGSIPDCWVDYCNNPADAWPIITENRISIIHLDDNEWGCRGEGDKSTFRAINSNALRCAMIIFLMMKEGEK